MTGEPDPPPSVRRYEHQGTEAPRERRCYCPTPEQILIDLPSMHTFQTSVYCLRVWWLHNNKLWFIAHCNYIECIMSAPIEYKGEK